MTDGAQTVPGGHGKKIAYAKDNMERMPYEYYVEKFKRSDPVSISTRLGIVYNLTGQEFMFMFMGSLYYIHYPDFEVRHGNPETETSTYYPLEEDIYTKILVLRYLLNASVFPHNGEFRSYKELPSGDLYARQFQGRCISRMNRKFGSRLELFEELYLRFIFWEGDEEFPPSSQILFSSNFPAAFGAYDLAEIGEICINTFCAIEKQL